MSDNSNLNRAKKSKCDEFYTGYDDIGKEMVHYTEHFRGKVIYCNTDTPRSNFVKYFQDHFDEYGLERLIATGIDYHTGQGWLYDLRSGQKEPYTKAIDSGDYKSPDNIEYLKQADIIITNPPFSLFREYVALMMEYEKKFIIIGNQNAITYKEVFPLIKENKLWLGVETPKNFRMPNGEVVATVSGLCRWYTNIPHGKRRLPLDFYKTYNEKEFPKYDNYEAINVNKTCDIPMDYYGVMGVPITFLDKYCPAQFEIVDARQYGLNEKQRNKNTPLIKDADSAIKGKPTYARILIRRRTDFPDDGTIYKEKE